MTTDITELAQSLKSAAEKAGIEQWVNNRGEVNTADYEVDGGMYIDHICDCEIVGTESPRAEFIALANPANVLALVEALEKAQQRIAELDIKNCELDSLTQRWAVERAENADRIAELESRAVTFKLPSTPEPSAFAPWVAKAFYQLHKDTVKSCVAVFSDACRAAGIKVEDE
ncbi:ead/Ea22-like family protein [Klebsiella pneumoniae]|uniref:ead/Ea22-like family protein n=1 Tax=Klebsiella pneumoniae TaxID=573 RepID=UPI0018DCE031|nr:ead/Ea22-like family protein [Klebsiella pneumoniae]MBH8511500.1 ead/Ea22-like family protein [Klebsiella pneumoniae]HEL5287663.1 ead/Ea22-like family protein [Klebsiella pneumoniae]